MKNSIVAVFFLVILTLSYTACTPEKSNMDYNELNRQRLLEIAKKYDLSEENIEFNFTNNKLVSEDEWAEFEKTAKRMQEKFAQFSKASAFNKAGQPFIDAHANYLRGLNPEDIDVEEANKILKNLQYQSGKDLNNLLLFVKSKSEIFDQSLITELESKIRTE